MQTNEPVAWMWEYMNDWHFSKEPVVFPAVVTSPVLIPLYTHPHPDNLGFALSIIDQQKLEIERLKAKTLTDEEIIKIRQETRNTGIGNWSDTFGFARAILKKASE